MDFPTVWGVLARAFGAGARRTTAGAAVLPRRWNPEIYPGISGYIRVNPAIENMNEAPHEERVLATFRHGSARRRAAAGPGGHSRAPEIYPG